MLENRRGLATCGPEVYKDASELLRSRDTLGIGSDVREKLSVDFRGGRASDCILGAVVAAVSSTQYTQKFVKCPPSFFLTIQTCRPWP